MALSLLRRTATGSSSHSALASAVLAIVRPSVSTRCMSVWAHLGEASLDGNHATNAAFEADQSPNKVNLGRGIYKDDQGKNWVLPSVKSVCANALAPQSSQ
jgi:hypothetical protein